MSTEQEQHWAGPQGNAYHQRAPGNVEANTELFCRILDWANQSHRAHRSINTALELGAGTGANLAALRNIMPHAHLTGVEINREAHEHLRMVADRAYQESAIGWTGNRAPDGYDLVLTKGFLIHVPPAQLQAAYDTILQNAGRWILLCEYYNPTPVSILYRGQPDRLWKRDFAGELLERDPSLRLVDYRFTYHRDTYPQDDVTSFLLERT